MQASTELTWLCLSLPPRTDQQAVPGLPCPQSHLLLPTAAAPSSRHMHPARHLQQLCHAAMPLASMLRRSMTSVTLLLVWCCTELGWVGAAGNDAVESECWASCCCQQHMKSKAPVEVLQLAAPHQLFNCRAKNILGCAECWAAALPATGMQCHTCVPCHASACCAVHALQATSAAIFTLISTGRFGAM